LQAIATVHGGNLVLNQPQEGGSEFSLQLPLDAQPPAFAGELS
jgi:signal transduction histidine kinase